jgi:hypothetical protein
VCHPVEPQPLPRPDAAAHQAAFFIDKKNKTGARELKRERYTDFNNYF